MPKKIEDVTQKIITAALEIYHQEGYDSLSMRRIAEISGLSVGTVYTHFEDKEALMAQVLAGEIEQIMNDFMRNVFGKEPKEALYGAIYCFIARMVETPQDVINQVVSFESDKEYIERTLFGIRKQVQELLIELITRVFAECKNPLTREEASVLSEILFSMLNAISLYGKGDTQCRSNIVYDMFIAYAEKDKGKKAKRQKAQKSK
ncbi:MAG: TetR/AcrR family transcriptional regulator [Christensenella sp.]